MADKTLRLRALRTEHVCEIPLAALSLAGQDLTAEVGHRAYTLRSGDRTVVRLVWPEGSSWRAELAGEGVEMRAGIVDVPREGDTKVDQFHVLGFRGPHGSWVMHFAGGRLAGERLVLVRGDQPGPAPVVSCVPAAQSRDLPRLRRRRPADVHLTTWTGEASPAEVALVEIVVLAGQHVGLDHLAAGVVGAARELAGLWRALTPLPDPLPTRTSVDPSGPPPPRDTPVGFGEHEPREGTST